MDWMAPGEPPSDLQRSPLTLLNTSAKAVAVLCNWLVMWRLQTGCSNAFKSQSERIQVASCKKSKRRWPVKLSSIGRITKRSGSCYQTHWWFSGSKGLHQRNWRMQRTIWLEDILRVGGSEGDKRCMWRGQEMLIVYCLSGRQVLVSLNRFKLDLAYLPSRVLSGSNSVSLTVLFH